MIIKKGYYLILYCAIVLLSTLGSIPWSHSAIRARATPNLREIPPEQAIQLAQNARNIRLALQGGAPFPVPWNWIQENCNRRASVLNFYFAQGGNPQPLPAPLLPAFLSKVIKTPMFDSIQIHVTGPLMGEQTILDLKNRVRVIDKTLYFWDHHVAALIRTGGEFKVIDPSVSDRPLTIQEWVSRYLPPQIAAICSVDPPELYQAVNHYFLLRTQFPNTNPPPKLCSIRFGYAYSQSLEKSPTLKEIHQDLEDSRSLLWNNFETLLATVQSSSYPKTNPSTLHSALRPMTEAEYCKAMNYAFKFCKKP